MSTDIIEREVAIAAPVERVWALVTQAEHLGAWFGDAGADIDLRPGGALQVRWATHELTGVVQVVNPTNQFSFRWRQGDTADDAELTEGNSTLVEFWFLGDGDTTHVRMVESGFALLPGTDEQRKGLLDGHVGGWETEIDELAVYAAVVVV